MTEGTQARAVGRSWLDRLAIVLLIGATAVSVGAVALLTVYLNRVSDASSEIDRIGSLGSYSGRPSAVVVDGVNAVNYVLTSTSADALDALVVAHLSASRQQLTLIAFPIDLQGSSGSLASTNRRDPLLVMRELERMTGARMDHLVQIDRDRFAHVVDALGGIELDGDLVSGAQAVERLSSIPAHDRSLASAEILRATLVRASAGSAITEPTRFDRVLNALTPCLKLDESLTTDEIQAILVESKVHADEIATIQVAVTRSGARAVLAEERSMDALRQAFATDDFALANPSLAVATQASPEPTK